MTTAYADLANSLKRVLRARDLTYEHLASELGMSVSGLKKVLAAEDCSYGRLQQICEILEIELADLLASSDRAEPVRLTETQEDALVAEPALFFLLWALEEADFDIATVGSTFELDDHSIATYVDRLVRLDLVRRARDGRLRRRLRGRIGWQMTARLGSVVMAGLQRGFLEHAQRSFAGGPRELFELGMGQMLLSKVAARELKQRLRDTVAEFAARARREAPFLESDDQVQIGILTVMAPFRLEDVIDVPPISRDVDESVSV